VTGCRLQKKRGRSLKADSCALKAGFTLIELLVYTAIMLLVIGTVGSMLLAIGRGSNAISAEQSLEQASDAMDRILRDTRSARSIDTANSTFGSTPGTLMLSTTDASNNALTEQFYLTGSSIHVKENGIDAGALTPGGARVTNLVFRHIATSLSEAVKVELTIESGSGSSYRSKKFYGTAVVRGSYQ